MAYSPFTWKDGNAGGTPLTAERLNALELGVKGAHDTADANATALDEKAPSAAALPTGGTAGQFLVKSSSADYVAGWQAPSTIVPSHTHPESDVTGLTSDLNALRTALFGGSARTRAPAAWAYAATDYAFAAGTNIVFASGFSEYADPDNMCTIGTGQNAPTEITAPVAGMYVIEFHMMTTQTTGVLYGSVLLNADNAATTASRVGTYTIARQAAGASSEANMFHLVFTRNLAAGDRLSFAMWGTTAATLKAGYFGGLRQTMFGARYVGPVQAPAA